MAVDMQVAEAAGRRYTALRAHLDERQRRLLLGVEAAELGRGGIWNKIEHRLQITLNWRGRPLRTHQVIVDLISNTTTATGLRVDCVLDTDQYPIGLRYTKKDIDALPITRHDFHGDWNYTLKPQPDTP